MEADRPIDFASKPRPLADPVLLCGRFDRARTHRGYDFDTFADDLAQLANALDLHGATFVGHSMGGGEVARYVARHGETRVTNVAFVASATPFLLKTLTNLGGAPKEAFDGLRASVRAANRSQWHLDVTMPY